MDSNTPLDQLESEFAFVSNTNDLDWIFQPPQQGHDQCSWDSGQLGMIDDYFSADPLTSTIIDLLEINPLSHNPVDLSCDVLSDPNAGLLHNTNPRKDSQVCYGAVGFTILLWYQKISLILAQIVDVKALIHNATATTDMQSAFRSFSVSKYGNYYGLWSEGILVAILDKRTCGIVQELARGTNCGLTRIQAFIDIAQWWSGISSDSQTINIDLNVYGPREGARQIGRLLNSIGISLQQPLFGLQGFTYYNPHFLHIDEIRGEDVYETPLLNIELVDSNPSDTGHDTTGSKTTTLEAKEEVDSILDSLAHHEILMERDTDRRMKTKLQHHQKQALDFILRRETGDLPADLTMWRETEDDDGDTVYQHIITGSRRPQIAEAKGGILADDMGLGKSIVSLSVIAASFDRALEFGKRTDSERFAQPNRKRSKATLIIVPSSRKLPIAELRSCKTCLHKTMPSVDHELDRRDSKNDEDQLFSNDVVLTTYATVAMESSGSEQVLRNVDWFRIILDEEDAATFRKFMVNQSSSQSSDRFKHLRLLLRSICLRRTREVIGLADAVPELRLIDLTPEERDEYDRIINSCRIRIKSIVSRYGKNINSTVLESMLRLRLFCNNGAPENDCSTGASDYDEILSYLQQILDDFRSPKGPNILLMTLGTGAVGLNLAVASRIYLLEPQWNPAIEEQAMSRALRLGQKEKVTIIRYIVRNSVEDSNILSRQANKLREARGGFEKHTRGVPSDKMQECLNLFSISEEDSNQAI
ncbi:hypothetical protein E8E14_002613 [Neopestalotiopsis sp. 37M]|nr:hypothetical protein E8E14_002613 [Neopestalotiopsis sp. 37M]